MKFYDRHKCHKMSFYDIYDGHKEFQKYGIMGIKLTVLIPVLQKIKDFQFSLTGESKNGVTYFQNFALCISLYKMGIFWGTPKTYRI